MENSALWIKDPLAILADGAERGIVLRDGRIGELVAAGRSPTAQNVEIYDAGQHVVLPERTPIANLHLTLLQKVGLQRDKFGDSTGTIAEI